MEFDNIILERADGVATIILNRPKVLNALNSDLIAEVCRALEACESDDEVGAIVLTGGDKVFAAGADIAEMVDRTYARNVADDFTAAWSRVGACRKPVVAAVAGYALGGGCELAMMCDFIIAADTARFGQPEIKLGVLPGVGGTQRLTRAVGKAKAMDMCLTGRTMDVTEAERAGLVSRVVPVAELRAAATEAAHAIAAMSRPVVRLTREAVNRAFETTLAEGCRYERRLFHSAFALDDQTEGMRAFLEKRAPNWTHR